MTTATHIAAVVARAIAPRRRVTVSEWADANRVLSSKADAEGGPWRTDRNPPLREPMNALSPHVRSVKEVVMAWPVQYGKTQVALNTIGCFMTESPCPIMVALPDENTRAKWVAQKFQPMVDSTPALGEILSAKSRDAANQKFFKDFPGGLLFVEHAGTPGRLKSATVRLLVVDELEEFVRTIGGDPVQMLDERTSAFPGNGKRLYISSGGLAGVSRIEAKYQDSDQRTYHVPCPHCGEFQALEWEGLHWALDGSEAWYCCAHNGCVIHEAHKTQMIAAGRWVAAHPGRKVRGYRINGLYYQFGLGPRWVDLVSEWLRATKDPELMRTFVNSRLARSYEDPAMRRVQHDSIRDRAEPIPLRLAQPGVLAVTAGVDTQDNRLAVHILGWGRGLACWPLDYLELMGDPEQPDVWVALTDLLNRPIEHALGGWLNVEATAIDSAGHRSEAVKAYVRARHIRRPLCITGAKNNNAPVLSRGKLEDSKQRGRKVRADDRGLVTHQVGTVAIKHLLYARLAADAETQPEARLVHLSEDFSAEYFGGLTAETYDPKANRFNPRRGAPRNEPLDTWVYGYAATHHPELRLHRLTPGEWDQRAERVRVVRDGPMPPAAPSASPKKPHQAAPVPTNPFASSDWMSRR